LGQVQASIWSASYARIDSDADQFYDSASVTFDPDLPTGVSGTVTASARLYTSGGTLVETKTQNYSLSGAAATSYTLSFSPVTTATNYYIWLGVYYSSTTVADDTWTSVNFALAALSVQASIYSATYTQIDSNSDGYYDSASVTFDPDLPAGDSGTVSVVAELHSVSLGLVESITQNYNLIGSTAQSFTIGFSPVTELDNYYIWLGVYYSSTTVADDSWTSVQFGLAPLLTTASIYSATYSAFDSDSDTYDDTATVTFDPDLFPGIEDNVTIIAKLIDSGSTIVETINQAYYIYGDGVDSFTLTFTTVDIADYYRVVLEIYYSDIAVPDDTWTSAMFWLEPLSITYLPYIFNASYVTQDTSDGDTNHDIVRVTVDPDVDEYNNYSITLVFYLFTSSNNAVDTYSMDVTIYGTDVDSFSHQFSVSTNGQYYVAVELYYSDLAVPDDSWSSETFYLYAPGNNPPPSSNNPPSSSSTPSNDSSDDTDGGNNPASDLPVSNIWMLISYFGIIAVIVRKRETKSN